MTQSCFLNIDLRIIFSIVIEQLNQIYEWFNVNKLLLNADKAKNSLFHMPSKTDDLPLFLPKLLINDNEVERVDQ